MVAYTWTRFPELASYVNLPTPTDIRNSWCFGLPLTRDDGSPIPDSDMELYIKDALENVESRMGTRYKPVKIVCNPDPSLVQGVDYDYAETPYDYDAPNWQGNWNFIQLRKRPAISIDSYVFKFPNGQQIFDFPLDWIKLYPRFGQVQLVPYSGFSTVLSTFPMFSGYLGRNIPQLLWISYTAGHTSIPQDINGVIARIASCVILGIAGDAALAGIASLSTSVDGLSESYSTTASATNATYGAHILQYQNELKDFWDKGGGGGKGRHMGIRMTGV